IVDGTVARHLNQPSVVDLNFGNSVKFALPDEGSRPVFVPLSSIVASSGVVAPAAGRVSGQFGRTLSRTSDLTGWARQASLRLRPNVQFLGRWNLDGTYLFTDARMEARGFDGATFNDPRAITSTRADFAPRQEITLSAGYSHRWFGVSLFGKVSSG